MTALIDMVGRRYGRLTVTAPAGSKFVGRRAKAAWWAKCDCGKTVCVVGAKLREGWVTSCGCLHAETIRTQRRGAGGRFAGPT